MKVVLLKDVKKVGRKYEIKDVSNGFALNFLIPQKMAEPSSDKIVKKIEVMKARDMTEKKIQEDLLLKNINNIEGITVEFTEKANDKGHLFKGIHKEEIVEAIKKQTSLDISPEYIILEKPIKEVGEFPIQAKVQDKMAIFKVIITAA